MMSKPKTVELHNLHTAYVTVVLGASAKSAGQDYGMEGTTKPDGRTSVVVADPKHAEEAIKRSKELGAFKIEVVEVAA